VTRDPLRDRTQRSSRDLRMEEGESERSSGIEASNRRAKVRSIGMELNFKEMRGTYASGTA
jgi:hypothetical protein